MLGLLLPLARSQRAEPALMDANLFLLEEDEDEDDSADAHRKGDGALEHGACFA